MAEDSIEKIAEKVSERMICESCGKEFSCGAKIGKCWCFAVELEAASLAKLREDFKSCLCGNCLKRVEENVHNSN
ncbi:MAG: cysteine-rich CWC family protein [Acidobacteriota bacterium]|nr:cysteine-rich CWC family protein [Acidobacteriota bacterium]